MRVYTPPRTKTRMRIIQLLCAINMRVTMSQEVIENTFSEFLNKICTIQHYQRVIKANTRSEIESLSKEIEYWKDKPEEEKKSHGSNLNLFTYICPYDGHHKPYNSLRTSVEEQVEIVLNQKNKQYQWLLVDAYEMFEDYLESLYAAIGFLDNNFWSASDFGDISISEIKEQDLSWFQKQAIAKKGTPRSILTRFRKQVKGFETLERNNATDSDLRLTISLVENLRHVIVHKNGQVGDKDEFIKKILKESCLYKDNKRESNAISNIECFLGNKGKYLNQIILVEQPTFVSGGFSMHINLHENLVGELAAYAELIKTETIKLMYPSA